MNIEQDMLMWMLNTASGPLYAGINNITICLFCRFNMKYFWLENCFYTKIKLLFIARLHTLFIFRSYSYYAHCLHRHCCNIRDN